MKKMLSIATDSNNCIDKKKLTLTELANLCGSRFIKLATRKKRIRVIITQNSIPYEESTTGWLITEANAEKVRAIYNRDWHDSDNPKDDPLVKENTSLKTDLADKIKRLEQLKKESKELQDTIKDLTSKNDTLEEQLIQSNNDYQRANKQLTEAVNKSQTLVEAQQKLTVVNMQMQEQISDLSGQVLNVNQKLSSSQQQVITQQEELGNKQKEINELKSRNEKLMNRGLFARIFNKDVEADD